MDKHRAELIQRIIIVMPIADDLLQRCLIHEEVYSNIHATRTSQEQMRLLYEALNSGGVKVKSAFYRILLEQQPQLVQDLGKIIYLPLCAAEIQCIKLGYLGFLQVCYSSLSHELNQRQYLNRSSAQMQCHCCGLG